MNIRFCKVCEQLRSLVILHKNSKGNTLIPTQRSATASDTKNALVFVRSRRLFYTRKIINPFNRKNGQEPAKNPKPRFRLSVCKNYLRLSYRSTEM